MYYRRDGRRSIETLGLSPVTVKGRVYVPTVDLVLFAKSGITYKSVELTTAAVRPPPAQCHHEDDFAKTPSTPT